MHHLLERQLKKIANGNLPSSPELTAILKVVSNSYDNYDNDHKLLERSFDISSKEFSALHQKVLNLLEELKVEKENVEQKVIERTRDLALANKRLMELDKLKTEFISVAAHQLRTPLSAIKWIFSLFIDENQTNLNQEQRSLIMKGNESNERMIKLVNTMLIITRIESGKVKYSFKSIPIEELIESVISSFAIQASARNINLSFEKPPNQLPAVPVDQENMRGALQNLIENALFYTKNGGTVTVKVSVKDTMIKVAVEDDGIGIPKHQQQNIFDKFFRADNANKMQPNGSGLGLFIAKDVIEKHGGTIGFESTPDKGTRFYFTLPLFTLPKDTTRTTN